MMKRLFLTIVLVCSLCVGTGSTLRAQDVSFEASVNTKKVSLGSGLQLTLTFNGVQNSSAPDLSAVIADFDVRYLGPSSRISIVNGHYSSMVAHIYNIFPTKTGRFQIPPITVNISGKDYTSEPIEIEVVDAALGPPTMSSQGTGDTSATTGLDDKIFMTLEVGKKEAFLGEKIPVTVRLFVNNLSVRDIQLPDLTPQGFDVDPWDPPQQYAQTIGGTQYQVVEFKTNISPIRSGALDVGPARLECNLLVRTSHRQSVFDSFGDPFGTDPFENDIFGEFFGGTQRQPLAVKSTGTSVEVRDLPQDNKPEDFSGAVGQFEFNVSVGPTHVKVGDPITVRMTLSGNGNLKSIRMPRVEDGENFKVYDPQIKQEEGRIISEQVIIPKSEKITEVPALMFSYFDTSDGQYKTLRQGPSPVIVDKSPESETPRIVETPVDKSIRSVQEPLGRDLIFIKESPSKFSPVGYGVYKSFAFWALVVLTLLIFGFTLGGYHRFQRLKTDVVYARRLKAPHTARKGLDEARKFMLKGQDKEFYDMIFKTLQEYCGHKFHLPPGSITVDALADVLNKKNLGKTLEPLRSVFDQCDMVRYASAAIDEGKMKEVFQKTREIIDNLERSA